MPSRKLLGGAALAAAITGGAAFGALIGTPDVLFAQESGTTTTAPSDGSSYADAPRKGMHLRHRGPGHHLFGQALEVAAEALGMTTEELRDALADGASIAQIAEQRDVELQTVIDALVADGTRRIDERAAKMKENLPDRVTALVNREGLGHPRWHGQGQPPAGDPPTAEAQSA